MPLSKGDKGDLKLDSRDEACNNSESNRGTVRFKYRTYRSAGFPKIG
jgi:hypothetical protein